MITPTRSSHTRYRAKMRDAVASLTITQRQAVFLTLVDDLPAGRVAYRLGMSTDTVERIAAAARTKLYSAVAE